MSLFAELRRRNVFKIGIAYVLMAWVLLQGADFALDLVGAPNWIIQTLSILITIGLPFVLFFAWAFELTPDGIRRESEVDRSQSATAQTGRKLDFLIIGVLVVALGWFAWDKWLSNEEPSTEVVAQAPITAGEQSVSQASSGVASEKSVAVLPFIALSSGPDDEYFADGLTEEILNALAQLPELLVTARTSAFHFKGQDIPVPEIANTLGVAHIVEGSVRRSGERLRVTAQLIRAADGFHLWSETYDSSSADSIAVQEDIAEQIALAMNVVLDESSRENMRKAGLRDPAAFIALQKAHEGAGKAHGSDQQAANLLANNRYFEQVLERVPDYAPAMVEHADAYVHIINDMSTGEVLPEVPDEVLANAYNQAIADYSGAVQNARTFEERNTIEFDLAVLTGNFVGIRGRVEAYLAEDNCLHPSWIDPLATVFGYASQHMDRLSRVLACDPLWVTVQFSRARAALWAGEPDLAIGFVESAREQLNHPWLDAAFIWALMAKGDFESAANAIGRISSTDLLWVAYHQITLAAAMGERERAGQLLQQFEAHPEAGGFLPLSAHAQQGNRARANELAARFDARAYGPLPLALAAMWCNCGAPFDLEVTPNFAAKLQEGNLPWPPPAVIDFPLKDW